MITQIIFDWAKQAPGRTAVIYNGQSLSYSAFPQLISLARSYFTSRGYVGAGIAVLAINNLLDFWVISLALKSLGLTTVVVPSVEEVGKLDLPSVRCVITSPFETWFGLDGLCAEFGVYLLAVSLAGETALEFEAEQAPYPYGGHILRTSGTTGKYKMVLMRPAFDAEVMRSNVELMGMNHDTVLCVFNFPGWTGVGYRIAASPWIVGGSIGIEQGRKLFQALFRPGVNHAILVPEMLASILAAPASGFSRNEKMLLIGVGGTMTRSQANQAKASITPRLFNWLASTEGGTIAFTPLDTTENHRWHRLITGREVEIVDEFDHPVQTGEVGRVRISTSGIPTSYLNDEIATCAYFKNGYFYPGDLAIIWPDGRMALHGRLTDVINLDFPNSHRESINRDIGRKRCLFVLHAGQ